MGNGINTDMGSNNTYNFYMPKSNNDVGPKGSADGFQDTLKQLTDTINGAAGKPKTDGTSDLTGANGKASSDFEDAFNKPTSSLGKTNSEKLGDIGNKLKDIGKELKDSDNPDDKKIGKELSKLGHKLEDMAHGKSDKGLKDNANMDPTDNSEQLKNLNKMFDTMSKGAQLGKDMAGLDGDDSSISADDAKKFAQGVDSKEYGGNGDGKMSKEELGNFLKNYQPKASETADSNTDENDNEYASSEFEDQFEAA